MERIRAGREKGLEAGHKLRKEIEAFACHASLENQKSVIFYFIFSYLIIKQWIMKNKYRKTKLQHICTCLIIKFQKLKSKITWK